MNALANGTSPVITHTRWRIDPRRSTVEFRVRSFYGLQTVKGRFERYDGTLDLSAQPSIELTIEADSLTTDNARRDEHLRSAASSIRPTIRRSGSSVSARHAGRRPLASAGRLHDHRV